MPRIPKIICSFNMYVFIACHLFKHIYIYIHIYLQIDIFCLGPIVSPLEFEKCPMNNILCLPNWKSGFVIGFQATLGLNFSLNMYAWNFVLKKSFMIWSIYIYIMVYYNPHISGMYLIPFFCPWSKQGPFSSLFSKVNFTF